MKKRIIDLTYEDIRRFIEKECSEYVSNQCYNCPLDIEGRCYADIKERLEKTIEVK